MFLSLRLLYYLPIAGKRTNGYMPFHLKEVKCKQSSPGFGFVISPISYNNNCFIKHASLLKYMHVYKNLFLRRKSDWQCEALDLAWVEKGKVIPDNMAPKS